VKICCISAYFGPLPSWYDFFVASARANPQIDWIVFNDTAPASTLGNVRLVPLTLAQFQKRAGAVLDAELAFSPYKVCDFKPLYGRIFEEELREYDYWGFGDIDLVIGRLDEFLPLSNFGEFDLVSSSARIVCGIMTFVRNDAKMVSYYTGIPGYRELLIQPKHVALDEIHFDEWVKAGHAGGDIRASFTRTQFYGKNGLRLPFRWKAGELWMEPTGRNVGYVHFSPIGRHMLKPDFKPEEAERGWGASYMTMGLKILPQWAFSGMISQMLKSKVEWFPIRD
jgi:hypothetical protein